MKNNLIKKIAEGEIKILREGKNEESSKGFYAPATITMININDYRCIVDPGCPGEKNEISTLLKKSNLSEKEIKKIFITHNHPDHIGNLDLFENATIYLPDSIFKIKNPNYFNFMPKGFYDKPGKSLDIEEGLKILGTPGHAGWDISILYISKRKEKILIAGDLFWSQKDWEDNSEFLELCMNSQMQKRSRAYVNEKLKPHVIIPGHGGAFTPSYKKNEKKT